MSVYLKYMEGYWLIEQCSPVLRHRKREVRETESEDKNKALKEHSIRGGRINEVESILTMNEMFGDSPTGRGGTAANIEKFRNQFYRCFSSYVDRLDE